MVGTTLYPRRPRLVALASPDVCHRHDARRVGYGALTTVGPVALGFSLAFLSASLPAATVSVDFSTSPGKVRKELHSANIRSRSYPRGYNNEDDIVRSLNQYAFRTHDAALESSGQMVVDTHCIFPLMHLDANDPKNYVFKPTDHLLSINLALGQKCFYRLGSSIEHTGDWGYNTLNPADHEKYAEVLAGIVRHYTKGWANGYRWGSEIIGWELFNEPDVAACWRGTWEDFRHLFITCLRRLKSEFPEIKVGGPAFGSLNAPWMNELLHDCRVNGLKPDFLSWHAYHNNVDKVLEQPEKVRALCAANGFPDLELIMNEWHYLPYNRFRGVQKGTPEEMIKAHEGPAGIKNIDSAIFALQVETGFHDTPLGQSYYYGYCYDSNWGFVDHYRRPTKTYYHLLITGEFATNCVDRATCTSDETSVRAFGAWTADRSGAKLVVSDYVGSNTVIGVSVAGAGVLRPASVRLLDNTHDLVDWKGFAWRDGALELRKDGPGSCAFVVDFR